MAFNPDETHDGHAAAGNGFTYRMIHMTPDVLTDMLADLAGAHPTMPLFAVPVITDPALAGAVRRLHWSLTGPASPLERSERLAAVAALAARHSAGPGQAGRGGAGAAGLTARDRARAAARVRAFLSGGDAAQRLPAPATAARGPPGPGQRGGRCRRRGGDRVRRPGPPHPVVPPLLRDHAGRLPGSGWLTPARRGARAGITLPGSGCRVTGWYRTFAVTKCRHGVTGPRFGPFRRDCPALTKEPE